MSVFGRFFTPEARFFADGTEGFAVFGPGHLCIIAACVLGIVLLVRRYRALPPELTWGSPRRKQLLAMALIPPALIATRMGQLASADMLWPIFWPLHICNICEYLWLAFALIPRGRIAGGLGNLLFCWSLLGGAGALLFPGWAVYSPLVCWSSLCGFAGHAMVIACTACLLAGHDLKPNVRWIWAPIAAGALGGLAFHRFNDAFGTNFFFVNDPAAAGAPFELLLNTFGMPGFYAAYLGIATAIWLVFYAVYALTQRRS